MHLTDDKRQFDMPDSHHKPLTCTSHYNHQVLDVTKSKQAYCHSHRDVKIVQVVSLVIVITLPRNIQAPNLFCHVSC